MADPITSFATERVGDWLLREVKFLQGVKEQVEEMKMELEWMQCFLEDADKNPISSRTFHHWVSQIKEANYEVEDAIDLFSSRACLRRKRRNWFERFFRSIIECAELHTVGRNIEAINSRLSTLRSRLQTYGVMGLSAGGREIHGSGSSSSQMIMPRAQNQSFSFITDHVVVGLEPAIEDLVQKVITSEKLVSVYGTGGIGKTTLAKKVYHHKKIRKHFRGFAWIYVAQQFTPKDLWAETLVQLTSASKREEKKIEKMGEEELKEKLKSVYEGGEKKCLVVVDGVRSNQEWDNLSGGFPVSSGNSKAMVITRNKDLAKGERFLPFKLLPLDPEKSSELLRKMVGEDAKIYAREDRLKIEELGEKMLKHCMGFPLAIVLLGGILSRKTGIWEWKEVLDNIRSLSRRCGNNEEWFGVLVLSYLDLPNWLKPCFLYLSQFPEDHKIKTKQLLRMWMAEGLIYTSNDEIEEEEMMEDVAERNLNELACRYLIQVKDEGSAGGIRTCGMHNVIREMCLWKAKQEKFVHIVNLAKSKNETLEALSSSVDDNSSSLVSASSASNITNIRRIAIFAGKVLDADTLPQNARLRSFVCFSHGKGLELAEWKQSKQNWKRLECLRVLVLEGVSVGDAGFAREIGTLSCLGYLSLSGSHISKLSSLPLSNLVSLETLDIRYCSGYEQNVPIVWKWKMENLKHMYLPKGHIRIEGLHKLPNLETLVNYHVTDFESFLRLMDYLAKLKKLTLLTVKASKVKDMFPSNEPTVFNNLQSLCLKSPYESEERLDLDAVMSGCPNLYKLSVQSQVENVPREAERLVSSHLTMVHLKFCGLEDLSWLGMLQHLMILYLECDSFVGEKMRFRENEFPQLKHLELDKLWSVREWTVDAGAMPSLCRLEINWCINLGSVPEGLKEVLNLKELEIRGMPFEFRERLEKGGGDYHIVKHVHHISFVDCDDGDD